MRDGFQAKPAKCSYLHRVGKIGSATCTSCNAGHGDLLHSLTSCSFSTRLSFPNLIFPLSDNSFMCLNDGSATRLNPLKRGGSSPDLSLIHSSRFALSEWQVIEEGGSDHYPILSMLVLRYAVNDKSPPVLRWCWSTADWPSFTAQLESWSTEQRTSWSSLSINAQTDLSIDRISQAARENIERAPGQEMDDS